MIKSNLATLPRKISFIEKSQIFSYFVILTFQPPQLFMKMTFLCPKTHRNTQHLALCLQSLLLKLFCWTSTLLEDKKKAVPRFTPKTTQLAGRISLPFVASQVVNFQH